MNDIDVLARPADLARIAEIFASQYSVPMDSARIYCCYPRRFVDVLRRHGHTLKKHQQNDAPLKSLAERTNIIANWLAQPATAPICTEGRSGR